MDVILFYILQCFLIIEVASLPLPKGTACTLCPPGEGVVTWCNDVTDTICKSCPPGTFSYAFHNGPCEPCSHCAPGFFELQKCTKIDDVICELCTWDYAPRDDPVYTSQCLKSDNGVNKQYDNKVPVNDNGIGENIQNDKGDITDGDGKDKSVLETDTKVIRHSKVFRDRRKMRMPELPGDVAFKWMYSMLGDAPPGERDTGKNDLDERHVEAINTGVALPPLPSDFDEDRYQPVAYVDPEFDPFVNPGAGLDDGVQAEVVKLKLPSDYDVHSHEVVTSYDDVSVHQNGVEHLDTSQVIYDVILPRTTTSETRIRMETSKSKALHPTPEVEIPESVALHDKEENSKESEQWKGSPRSLVVAVIISAILCFFVGFYCRKPKASHNKDKTFSIKPKYQAAAKEATVFPEQRKRISHTPPPIVRVTSQDDEEEESVFLYDTESDSRPNTPSLRISQSPVDIISQDTKLDASLNEIPLQLSYVPENTRDMTNTGQTIKIAVDYHDSKLTGGPLGQSTYRLDNIHFHWGDTIDRGSEHTANGRTFPAECHFEHWNSDLYETYEEASVSDGGLAILAIFFQVDGKMTSGHVGLDVITKCLAAVRYGENTTDKLSGHLDPAILLPENHHDYWTYDGSVTSYPYHESVTWVIFKQPITISNSQIERFRHVHRFEKGYSEQERLVNNYRSLQPLGDREIKTNSL